MKTTTLDTLRSDVRFRVDIESTSDRLTDAQLARLINKSIDNLTAVITAQGGADWYYTVTDGIELSANDSTVSLLSDLNNTNHFHKLIKVSWMESYTGTATATGRMYPMRRASVDDYNDELIEGASPWSAGNLPEYRLIGDLLKFGFTSPNAEGLAITFSYIPKDLSLGSDTVLHGAGWDEWIVLDVCAQIEQRGGRDVSAFLAQRGAAEARIVKEMQERDEWGLAQVRDSYGDDLNGRELRNWVTHNW